MKFRTESLQNFTLPVTLNVAFLTDTYMILGTQSIQYTNVLLLYSSFFAVFVQVRCPRASAIYIRYIQCFSDLSEILQRSNVQQSCDFLAAFSTMQNFAHVRKETK